MSLAAAVDDPVALGEPDHRDGAVAALREVLVAALPHPAQAADMFTPRAKHEPTIDLPQDPQQAPGLFGIPPGHVVFLN